MGPFLFLDELKTAIRVDITEFFKLKLMYNVYTS